MRCAVIDMGTNTFHLLIVERDDRGAWQPLVRHRIFVKLAEEGLRRIGDLAFKRGLKAMKLFKTQLDAADVHPKNIKAFGTAALRTASNAKDFLEKVQHTTGIRAETITGEIEADLIFRGVRRAVPFPDNNVLIIDIGGGSVEFIIANRQKMLWSGSFEIGVSVLFQNFHKTDPISSDEILGVEDFLDIALKNMWLALKKFPVKTMIGAAGAFDVIDNFLLDPITKPPFYGYTHVRNFEKIAEKLTASTLAERKKMPQLSQERMEMIVVALVLIQFVIKRTGIFEIYTSEYSMKEGMLERYF